MGVWGWDEIKDGVTLQGTVTENAGVASDDKDWDFHVKPTRGFEYLLTNPSNNTNTTGTVECEIKPRDDLGPDNSQDPGTLDKYLGNLDGAWVTLTGTWAVDKSHSYDHENEIRSPGGSSSDGKTEIHPITSILVEHPPAADNSSRLIDFLVFSDIGHAIKIGLPTPITPGGTVIPPAAVPHSDEDRQAQFDMPIPLGSGYQVVFTFDLSDLSGSSPFTTTSSGRFQTLHCAVSSGKPSDGKGFYYAQVKLPGFTLLTYLVSRGIDLKFGIRDLMAWANVSSLRALFKRLDTGAFQPPQPPLPPLLQMETTISPAVIHLGVETEFSVHASHQGVAITDASVQVDDVTVGVTGQQIKHKFIATVKVVKGHETATLPQITVSKPGYQVAQVKVEFV